MRVIVIFFVFCSVIFAGPQEHLIKNLPGLSTQPKFRQYAGLVDFASSHSTKHLFYWFVESQRDPLKDPVVLWLNGGPGASSLLGLLTEHGPFRVAAGGKLEEFWNIGSWNSVSNVLFLESPVGVGFSWSDNPDDLKTDDATVSRDVADFLGHWFALFPEHSSSEFLLSGESYAGHYCTSLAIELRKRRASGSTAVPKVSGLILGNPLKHADSFVEPNTDEVAHYDLWPLFSFLRSRGFVSARGFSSAAAACGWDDGTRCPPTGKPIVNPPECVTAINTAWRLEKSEAIDWSNLEAPVCLHPGAPHTPGTFDPCLYPYLSKWANLLEVQQALHANVTLPVKWSPISHKLLYSNESIVSDVEEFYQTLLADGSCRILVFSGQSDAVVPFVGTERWVRCLGRRLVSDWRPWYLEGQFAGLVIEYDGISLLTIRTSGHSVSYYTPGTGLAFFQRFIDHKPF